MALPVPPCVAQRVAPFQVCLLSPGLIAALGLETFDVASESMRLEVALAAHSVGVAMLVSPGMVSPRKIAALGLETSDVAQASMRPEVVVAAHPVAAVMLAPAAALQKPSAKTPMTMSTLRVPVHSLPTAWCAFHFAHARNLTNCCRRCSRARDRSRANLEARRKDRPGTLQGFRTQAAAHDPHPRAFRWEVVLWLVQLLPPRIVELVLVLVLELCSQAP